MDAGDFDQVEFFRAISACGVRALLIGRQALIALGIPVITKDYDFWLHRDDAAAFNAAVATFGLVPTRSPEDARQVGRYALENSERVDIIVARGVATVDGQMVWFDDVWSRRQEIVMAPGVTLYAPAIPDLILTKRFGARPRDAEDIRWLEALQSHKKP